MKRQSFLLAGAGAALAGCANGALPPNTTSFNPSQHHRPAFEQGLQMLGSLLLVPYDYVVKEFAACDGAKLPIQTNVALFSLLGIQFGGDGKTDFGLPDMRGKEPIKGLAYQIAVKGRYPSRKQTGRPNEIVDPLLGQLLLVPYLPAKLPPPGWAICDGSILQIQGNQALFAVIGGNKFGGDGQTTFALPDLRDHTPHKDLTYLISMRGRFPTTA